MRSRIENKITVFGDFINIKRYKFEKIVFMLCTFFSFVTNAQTLQEYIKEGEQNNPQLKSMQYDYEMALEKVHESGSIPNTNFEVGYFVSEPETRTGPQKAKFGAKQPMPWFGTLKARKAREISASEISKNSVEIIRRKIALKVKQTYYKLFGARAKEKILKQQKELLKNSKEISISEVANNKVSAVDVLRINIAQNQLDNEIEILKGMILNIETTFNKLLDRDGFDPLVVPNNLIIPDEEPTLYIDDVTYHPELLKYDNLDEMINAQKKVNDKERLPGLAVGLDYIIVQKHTDHASHSGDSFDNGKDVIMPMLSLSIPLFSKKYTSRNKQFELQQESFLQQRESEQNRLEEILEKALNNRITARINYNTQVKNKDQAKQAETVVLSAYKTGQLDFNELLEIQDMALNFEIKKIEALQDYFIQTAIINYLN